MLNTCIIIIFAEHQRFAVDLHIADVGQMLEPRRGKQTRTQRLLHLSPTIRRRNKPYSESFVALIIIASKGTAQCAPRPSAMRHNIEKRPARQFACSTFFRLVSPKGDFLDRFVVPIEIHIYLKEHVKCNVSDREGHPYIYACSYNKAP